MKKFFFCFLFVSFASFALETMHKVEELSLKVVLEDRSAYFIMESGAVWKVVGFQKRWRGPLEWWNDVQLAPVKYESDPMDWQNGSPIEAFIKQDVLDVDETNAANHEALKKCSHLLVNAYTGQTLFAIPQHPKQYALDIYKEAKTEGYRKGYRQGREEGYNSGYKGGYQEGEKAGYRSGYDTGKTFGYERAKRELEGEKEEGAPY